MQILEKHLLKDWWSKKRIWKVGDDFSSYRQIGARSIGHFRRDVDSRFFIEGIVYRLRACETKQGGKIGEILCPKSRHNLQLVHI